MPRILLCLLPVLVLSCRGDRKPPNDMPVAETTLTIRVPFASSGSVEVRDLEDNRRWTAALDDAGVAELKLFAADGDFGVTVSNVNMLELATGGSSASGEMQWRVPALDVEKIEHRDVVVNPWKHIAWAGSGEDAGRYQAWHELGERMLTCGKAELAGVLETVPQLPGQQGDGEALTPAAWAYQLWGGWSELGAWLSREASVPVGTRIHTMSLTEDVALDASTDGIVDGMHGDTPIELVAGFALPADLMRQPFAQAIRRFADSERNELGISSEAILDFLECLSATTENRWGGHGETLDIEPASLVSEVPVDGAVIHGQQDYRCEAHDALSAVVSIDVRARRAGGTLEPLLTQVERSIEGQNATFGSVLDTGTVPDGEIELVCSASDRWGNQAQASTSVASNNDAGSVAVAEPAADSKVSGERVFIRCACQDDQLEDCYLSRPAVDSEAVVDIQDDKYLLDTTGFVDGVHAIECSSKSTGIDPVSSSIPVEVDNVDPTTWTGAVLLDSPVVGATVEARLVRDDGTTGHVFATGATDGMGRFGLDMPDNVAGWVLITAHGLDATFINGAVPRAELEDRHRGVEVRFRSEDKLWLLERYTPTRPAEPLNGLSVNAYSTAVAQLAFSSLAQGELINVAVSQANRPIGRILDRQNGMNVGRTIVRDFVSGSVHSGLTDRASTRLGLGHVGLSRLGAERAVAVGDDPNSLNSLYFLPYILRDLENAVLDGRDGHDAIINVTLQYDLSHLTMRWELAVAIAHWLDNVPLGDRLVGMNRTDLVASSFSTEDGFLRLVAENDSPLFGGEPYRPFDQWGPDLARLELLNGEEIRINPETEIVHGEVVLVVRALDPSGFSEDPIKVEAWPGPLGEVEPVALFVNDMTLDARFRIATGVLTDGPQVLTVYVTDSLGNTSSKNLSFTSDNTAPTVTAEGPSLTRSTSITVTWSASDAVGPIAGLRLAIDGRTVVEVENPASTGTSAVTLPSCNATYSVEASATDAAGWVGRDSFAVRCDNTAPALLMGPSNNGTITGATYNDAGQVVYAAGASVSLRDLGWPGAVLEISAYANHLDVWSPHVWWIEFSASESVTATYRYAILDKPVHQASLAPDGNGLFRLPIAYQALLPPDATPETNEMARADADDVHHLVVDLVDAAGNSSSYEFPFRLSLKAPPVGLRDCRISQRAANASLTPPTLHQLFTSDAQEPLMEAEVVWNTGLANGSLMPREAVTVQLAAGYTMSEWQHGLRVRHRTEWTPARDDYPCHYIQDMHIADPPYCTRSCCTFGLRTVNTSPVSSGGTGIRNTSSELTFRRVGAPAALAALPPNARWQVSATGLAPRVTNRWTGEAEWDWPIDGGEYRLQLVETGSDFTYDVNLGDEMYGRQWAVVRAPVQVGLRVGLIRARLSVQHPVGYAVGLQRLGSCQQDALFHTWQALPPDASAGGGS